MQTENGIFRVGDKVFTYIEGWGKVINIAQPYGATRCTYPVEVVFSNGNRCSFTLDGRTLEKFPPVLSFKEYIVPICQERPLPDIPLGTLIYVRAGKSSAWNMRFFSNFDGNKVACFMLQKKEGSTLTWGEWSLTNPLLEE